MAIPTALLAKVLGGLGVLATAATVIGVTVRPKDTTEETLKALNEKIKDLGITDCVLGEDEISKTCTLDKGKIEKIKFDGKNGNTVTESASLNLTIEKGYEDLGFPQGLRFSFTNSSTNDITIGSGSNQITFKQGVSYDYKMKTEDSSETKLEKAWTITTLGAKVGLTCQTGDTTSECTLKTEGINVWKEEEDYITGATQADSNKKMTVEKESSGYLEGFKFTVKESEDITLTEGTKKKTDGISKLTKTGKSYGIDVKDIGGTKTWFLIEKSTTVPQESQ